MKYSSILALALALMPVPAIAQEYPGCFMLDSSGSPIDLSSVCGIQEPRVETTLNGLRVSDTIVEETVDDNLLRIKGKLVNETDAIAAPDFIYYDLKEGETLISTGKIPVARDIAPGSSTDWEMPVTVARWSGDLSAIRLVVTRIE